MTLSASYLVSVNMNGMIQEYINKMNHLPFIIRDEDRFSVPPVI